MSKGSMRDQMPATAAWIDKLREAFGKESIDQQIRAGLRGKPVFYASENGHTLGTRPERGWRVVKDERGNPNVVLHGDGERYEYVDGEYRPSTERTGDGGSGEV